uniref:Uncharacterized protein n=1 Tax=Anopheles quadriannulatus TaxID=34691 RepID=A0A182XQQ0_ANOQN
RAFGSEREKQHTIRNNADSGCVRLRRISFPCRVPIVGWRFSESVENVSFRTAHFRKHRTTAHCLDAIRCGF